MADSTTQPVDNSRDKLAYIVIYLGVGIIVIIAAAIALIRLIPWADANDLKMVFNALVPVVSTWIGTVIAFYFGRENFESANKQIAQIVGKITPEMYKSVPVKQVMIDFETMVKMTNASLDTTLDELGKYFSSTSPSRLPIVDKDCKPLFIIHKSEYERLIKEDETITDATQKNAVKKIASFKKYGEKESFGFVIISETATLSDAQKAVASIATCKDVFITEKGTANEKLLGWMTDSRIVNFLQ